jgi:L-lactate dehydrogenase complex protein LldF
MRVGMGVFTFVASRPRLYRLGTAVALRVLRLFGRGGWIRAMPGLGAWTAHRDFPAPQGPSFMARYAGGEGADR